MFTTKTRTIVTCRGAATVAAVIATAAWVHAGDLDPPIGTITPTMKTLDEVEPRIPIHAADLSVTISDPGSYYLADDATNAPGKITISADNVTLDLMGFSLTPGEGVTGDGIRVTSSRRNITIKNGAVSGWSGDGVDAWYAHNSRLTGLRIWNNAGDGLRLGSTGTIAACTVEGNGGHGITANDGVTVTDCTAVGNGTDGTGDGINVDIGCTITGCTTNDNSRHGILTDDASIVSNCTAEGNGTGGTGDGIHVDIGCSVSDCTATSNANDGIFAQDGTTVRHCSVEGNGAAGEGHGINVDIGCTVTVCTAKSNASHGIVADAGSTITGCTSVRNTGDGIRVSTDSLIVGNNCRNNGYGGDGDGIHVTGSDNRIEGNNVTDNDRGIAVDASGNLIIRNSASNSVNYAIQSGNDYGEIIDNPGAGFTNCNPWANFVF